MGETEATQRPSTGRCSIRAIRGTAVAVSRALVAILENNQQADGSVLIPEALRPWVGKDIVAPRPRA